MMVLRNGPNFRPGSKEEEEEINHLIEAASKVWSESLNQNPEKSHCASRPRARGSAHHSILCPRMSLKCSRFRCLRA